MYAKVPRWRLVLCMILLGGCASNPSRWPFMRAGDPAIERRAYEYHDPLPDSLTGPQTYSRPRGFDIQRAEPRRTRERAGNVAPPPSAMPPYAPQTSSYPNTVSPE